MRRNLEMTHRYLRPLAASALQTVVTRKRLAEATGLAVAKNPVLQLDADEARKVAVRFVFDEMVASSRAMWVGGIPTGTDLAVLTDRVRFHLGLTRDEVNAALDGHPRPTSVG